MKSRLRPVKVTWVDSLIIAGAAWVDLPDAAPPAKALRHTTVGYLVRVTKSYLLIASNLSPGHDRVGCVTTIPRSAVVKVRDLH